MKRALVPAAVMAIIIAPNFGTPELLTELILAGAGFITALVAMAGFWRLTSITSWARWKQRLATWLAAAGGAAAGCCLLLAPVLFKR
jgi:H+/Cl- antiporter ClcA